MTKYPLRCPVSKLSGPDKIRQAKMAEERRKRRPKSAMTVTDEQTILPEKLTVSATVDDDGTRFLESQKALPHECRHKTAIVELIGKLVEKRTITLDAYAAIRKTADGSHKMPARRLAYELQKLSDNIDALIDCLHEK